MFTEGAWIDAAGAPVDPYSLASYSLLSASNQTQESSDLQRSAFGNLADSLKPNQSGSKVTVSIDGKVIGPAVANILPMMMMRSMGGGPPAAEGGPAGATPPPPQQ